MLQKRKYSLKETQACDSALPGKKAPWMLEDMAVGVGWTYYNTKQSKLQFSVDNIENWLHISSSSNVSNCTNADKTLVFVVCKQTDTLLPVAEGNVACRRAALWRWIDQNKIEQGS